MIKAKIILFLIMLTVICQQTQAKERTGKREYINHSQSRSKTGYTPDSVYQSRMKALPFQCEMFYNASVRKYIELYTIKAKSSTGRTLGLGTFYFPIIDSIFQSYSVPAEMKYIAIVESSLNPAAVANGVAGMWQFTKGTGQKFGLRVNSMVDERRSVVESTVAVAKYLKQLHDMYSDWRLVLAAYNCGSGTVNHAIRNTGGKSDFWKIYPHLPQHTRNFVPAFMGVAYAFNYYKEYGITPGQSNMPASIDTVTVSQHLHLQQVASVLSIDIQTLRKINTQYLRDVIPADKEKTYPLYLPSEHKAGFLQQRDSIYSRKATARLAAVKKQVSVPVADKANSKSKITHKVCSGENLTMIAKRYKVSVEGIKRWNNLQGTKIKSGQRLVILK